MLIQMFNLILKLAHFILDRRRKQAQQKVNPTNVDFELYVHISKGKD